MSYPQRVATRAAEIQPTRALLSLVAFPFYVLGLVLGVLLAAVLWSVTAVRVGIDDVKQRLSEDTDDGAS